ncbi:MAG: hypothetical protein HY509_00555, partial [Acidobacteria bacterium]|nr:hypothetical protein [Acidobacteriota bacterium]
SHQVGVVLSPGLRQSTFPRIELHRLEGSRVLAIFVDPRGLPQGRILAARRAHSQADLDRMGAALERRFAGMTLGEMRKRLPHDPPAREEPDPLLWQQALGLLEDFPGQAGGEDAVFVEGTEDLLNEPEFADVERLRSLFRALQRRKALVEILQRCMAPVGVQVHIGSETLAPDLSEFALVTSTYGPCDCPLGSLGILGPIRMEYDRAIAVVEYVSGYFSRLLTGPAH